MLNINLNAPILCKKNITINASSVSVWEILTGIDAWHEWQLDIKKSSLKGPVEKGSAFSWKSGGMNINSIIHIAEPYTLFGWSGKTLGLSAVHNWKIVELNKQTEVYVEESMEGLLAKLFKKTLNKKLEKNMERWLNFLKEYCERKHE